MRCALASSGSRLTVAKFKAALEKHSESATDVGPESVPSSPDPGYREARYNLAVAQLEDRRFAPALENLKALAPTRPGDPMIQYYLGRAFEGLGRKDAAAASYRKALEIAPDLSDARGALAKLEGPPG